MGLRGNVSVSCRGTMPCVNATQGPSSQPPEWVTSIHPGRLDVRLLSQETFWVTRDGTVLQLDHMSVGHLQAVAGMLRGRAMVLHLRAIVDAIIAIDASQRSGVPCRDTIEFLVTGSSITDLDARAWAESMPLMRRIDRLLAKPD